MDTAISTSLQRLGFDSRNHRLLLVDVANQTLCVYEENKKVLTYPVSTSKYGVGAENGSHKTPPGMHRINAKIGEGEALGEVFKGRVPQGYQEVITTAPVCTDKDAITSRIMWLEGLEAGVNQGEGVDSYQRYIYIHGTHEEGLIGQPASIGCVRMKNADVIALFERVAEGDLVFISEAISE